MGNWRRFWINTIKDSFTLLRNFELHIVIGGLCVITSWGSIQVLPSSSDQCSESRSLLQGSVLRDRFQTITNSPLCSPSATLFNQPERPTILTRLGHPQCISKIRRGRGITLRHPPTHSNVLSLRHGQESGPGAQHYCGRDTSCKRRPFISRE